MMKCEIIRDLMPGYIDEITSKETNQEIQKHLAECQECRDFMNSMKQPITAEIAAAKDSTDIQPFKKLKKALTTRTVILVIFVIAFIGLLIYGQYESYYLNGKDAFADDVTIEYEADPVQENMKVVTLYFRPAKENISLTVGYNSTAIDSTGKEPAYHGSKNTYIGAIKRNIKPSEKDNIIDHSTWEYWFLDENTLFDPLEKKEIKLSGDEKLIIEFAGDVTKEIRFTDLYTGNDLEKAGIVKK